VIWITAWRRNREENSTAESTALTNLPHRQRLASARLPACDTRPSEPFTGISEGGVMKSTKVHRPQADPATLLQTCNPEALQWEMQDIQLAIARRAFELFQARNREHGHDWEDWFQAESEVLRPVSIAISETADRFSIRVNVFGLSENEIKVSVEPRRISILGRKQIDAAEEAEADSRPEQILRRVDLSSEIETEGVVVELQSGVLKFELPKVAQVEPTTEAKAAGVGSI
jgi:HSP20 family molecular chaperone IbpA